jgi:hypothetical protein
LHNPKQAAPFAPSAKNEKKGIVLRHENKRLEFSFDRDKLESAWVVGQDAEPQQQMVISEEQGLAFAGKQGQVKIEVEDGDVSWITQKGVNVSAAEQVTLEGKTGVQIASEQHIELNAQTKLSGQGKQGVAWVSEQSQIALTPEKTTVSANEVAVEGALTVKVSGTESVKVSGMLVVVQGSAEVSVKGALVNLG